MIWLVRKAAFGSADLHRLLDAGWEPFAAAHEPTSIMYGETFVYLRAEREEPAAWRAENREAVGDNKEEIWEQR